MAKVLQKVFDQVHERVAGLDVHKVQVTAAVRVPARDGGRFAGGHGVQDDGHGPAGAA